MHPICELKIIWTTLNGRWKWKEKVSGNQLIQHQNWLAKLLAEAICTTVVLLTNIFRMRNMPITNIIHTTVVRIANIISTTKVPWTLPKIFTQLLLLIDSQSIYIKIISRSIDIIINVKTNRNIEKTIVQNLFPLQAMHLLSLLNIIFAINKVYQHSL